VELSGLPYVKGSCRWAVARSAPAMYENEECRVAYQATGAGCMLLGVSGCAVAWPHVVRVMGGHHRVLLHKRNICSGL
jgi:hypothetical protein